MHNHIFSTLVLLLVFLTGAQAQQDNRVLFSVEGTPVTVSEFDYIYSKTNGEQANYAKASLEEYLDLYIKFKLKVQKAKALQLDTIPELQRELAGYRRQLADSYLINKEVTEQLTREAYERKQQDVDISHIFFRLPTRPAPKDTLAAYQKAMSVKRQLDNGASFSTLAKSNSDDNSVKNNAGHIGYVTALFPKGYYGFETAAYTLPLNTVSMPVRTSGGYHLVKAHDRRPARGEVETAHILLRTEGKPEAEVKQAIDQLYQELENGANFEALAREHSEDARTAPKGGYIGFIAINRFQEAFENAVFALSEDNTYSAPFKSDLGYHIVKRISKKTLGSYEEEKAAIEAQIQNDDRFEASRLALIQSIKRNAGFQEFPLVLEQFAAMQNDTFFTFRWKEPTKGRDQVLFNLGAQRATIGDFATFLVRAGRQRLQLENRVPPNEAVKQLYGDFVEDYCMRFEESKLEEKYPEFKALMREYEEGILLFEVTKRNVWDKAARDTSGLRAFYETIKGKYRWNERAVVDVYTLPKQANPLIQAIREYAKDHTIDEVKQKFEVPGISTEQKTVEKEDSPSARQIREWEVGYVTNAMKDSETGAFTFTKVVKVMPAQNKALNEARGYIIADYQDYLEQQWVEQLRKEYEVEVNRKVFDTLIK
ncbi:MAG TPA: peptidylprolyl isomerase [Saprospiraceae bacterium]|nr:peptidylprolyl isomerase [Saprospiraceae bacterium]